MLTRIRVLIFGFFLLLGFNVYGTTLTTTSIYTDLDATVDSGGTSLKYQNWIKVGDAGDNDLRKALCGINLNGLPAGAIITSSTLYIQVRHGKGYTNYNPFYIGLVDFGNKITSADYNSSFLSGYSNLGQISDNSNTSVQTVSIPIDSNAVQYAFDNAKSWSVYGSDKWFQIMIYSKQTANNDGIEDSVWIGTADAGTGCSLKINYTVPSGTHRMITNSYADMDGFVTDGGGANKTANWIKVGDYTNNALRRGFVGISLSNIPSNAHITSAKLRIKRRHGTGTTNYNPFKIGLVDFGDTLQSGDYNTPFLSNYSNLGYFSDLGTTSIEEVVLDLNTATVQYCLDNPKSWTNYGTDKWFQVMFYSSQPANNDSIDDCIWIGTTENTNAVILDIYYTVMTIPTNAITVILSTNVNTNLDPNFTGVNATILQSYPDPWNSVTMFSNAIHRMGLRKIRYPGGTISQSWDWLQGKADSYASSYYYPADTKTAIDVTGGDVTWVINMNKSLNHNITGLSNALKAGVSIKYIEMQNEGYYDDNWKSDNGVSYAQTCQSWITTLHQKFPGVKCAVDQTMKYTGNMQSWHDNVFANCNNYDAVIIHWYPNVTGIDYTSGEQIMWNDFTNKAGLAELLGTPPHDWADLRANNDLPADVDIWLTEFDINGNYEPCIKYTWAQALFNLSQINVMLNDGRVRWFTIQQLDRGGASCMWEANTWLSDYTYYYPTGENLATGTGELTSKGMVIRLLSPVVNDSTNAIALEFTNIPMVSAPNINPYPPMFGWKFYHQDGTSAVFLVNISSNSFDIDTTQIGNYTGMVYQMSNNPIRILPKENRMPVNFLGNLTTYLTLPPYSFTTITGISNITMTTSVPPNLQIAKYKVRSILNGKVTNILPGGTVTFRIDFTNAGGVSTNTVIWDKMISNTVYYTDFLFTGSNWITEYSTNINPSVSYISIDFSTVRPAKDKIKWIRWKKPLAQAHEKSQFKIRVIVK